MKTIITLVAVLFSTFGLANAQLSAQANNPNWKRNQDFFKKIAKATKANSATKTRAADMRLIANVYEEFDVTDSAVYTYHPNRGSHLEPTYGMSFDRIDFETGRTYDPTNVPAFTQKAFRTYDNNNLVLTQIDSTNNGTSWDPLLRQTFTYTATNQLSTTIQEFWSGTAWENSLRITNTYTAGNLTQELYETWNVTAWENIFKIDYVFTGGNITEQTFYTWNITLWEPSQKAVITYNASNQILTQLSQIPMGTTWVDESRETYSYTTGNLSDILLEEWNGTNWDNIYHLIVAASANRITSLTYQTWTNAAWVNENRSTLTYNANKYITSELYESWNGTAFAFNPNNGDYMQRFYYENYNANVAVNDVKAAFGNVAVYPNPTQNTITIELEKNSNTAKQISVVDMMGAVVATSNIEKNAQRAQINLAALPVGNYLVKVTDETGAVYNTKITKN